jgi:hypothetical protein
MCRSVLSTADQCLLPAAAAGCPLLAVLACIATGLGLALHAAATRGLGNRRGAVRYGNAMQVRGVIPNGHFDSKQLMVMMRDHT